MTLEFGGNVKSLNSPRSGLGGWRGTPLGRRWRSQDAHIGCPLAAAAGSGPISLFKAPSCLQSPGRLSFCSRRKHVQSWYPDAGAGQWAEKMRRWASSLLVSLALWLDSKRDYPLSKERMTRRRSRSVKDKGQDDWVDWRMWSPCHMHEEPWEAHGHELVRMVSPCVFSSNCI